MLKRRSVVLKAGNRDCGLSVLSERKLDVKLSMALKDVA